MTLKSCLQHSLLWRSTIKPDEMSQQLSMKPISLSQALKLKNRLAGKIARLRLIVERENSRKESHPVRADVRKAFEESVACARELAALKGSIAAANAGVTDGTCGIYGKLNLQAELRGLIAFLNALNCKEGETTERVGFLSRDEATRVVFFAVITKDQVDRHVAEHQAEIERLQDEIDQFNAATRIVVAA
jgi:hypothetical protein